MPKVKKGQVEEVYIVVPWNSALVERKYDIAKKVAIEECNISGEEMLILKVVKVDTVSLPADPEPEVHSHELGEL